MYLYIFIYIFLYLYVFLGPSGRCLEGLAASSASHHADNQYNFDNIWRFLLSTRSSSNSCALCSLVLFSALF